MVKTLQPWSILDPQEYAVFVEENILSTSPVNRISKWKADAAKFRVCVQKLLGEDRLTRYEWMLTDVGVFFLIHAYRMKTTVRDLFGLDNIEHKNLIFKQLLPKITQNLKNVLLDFDKMIRRLLSVRYDEDELNSLFDSKQRQTKICKRYAKRRQTRLILNPGDEDTTDEDIDIEQPVPYQTDQNFASSVPMASRSRSNQMSAEQCSRRYTGTVSFQKSVRWFCQ